MINIIASCIKILKGEAWSEHSALQKMSGQLNTCAALCKYIIGHKAIAQFVNIILLTLLGVSFISFIFHSYHIITFPYELTSGEGLLLSDASRIYEGKPIYTDPNRYPYIISIYPPVFSFFTAILSIITGIGLFTSRIIAVSSTLLTCIFLGTTIYYYTKRLIVSIMIGLLYTTSIFVYQWSVFGRVDTLAVLLSVLAISLIIYQVNFYTVLIAAIICVLGIYTKQTAISAPLSIAIYLFLIKRRFSFLFSFVFLVSFGVVFFILNSFTSGRFYQHTIQYNIQPYSINAMLSFIRVYVLLNPILLICSVIYIYIYSIKTHKAPILPVLYFLISGLSTITVGRAGSTINHFLENIAALTIIVGLFYVGIERELQYAKLLAPTLLIAQIIWLNAFPYTLFSRYYQPDPAFTYTPTEKDIILCQQLDTYVKHANNPILAEEVGIVVSNHKEAMGSAWMFNILHGKGIIDRGYEEMRNKVRQKKFSLILLHWQSYPSEFLFTVAENYRKIDTITCGYRWEVFVPQKQVALQK